MVERKFLLPASLLALVFIRGNHAQASYSYSTSLVANSLTGLPAGDTDTIVNTPNIGAVITITSPTGVTTISLTDVNRTGFAVPSINTANFGNVSVTTTEPSGSAGLSVSINYTDSITLTNSPPPGTAATSPPLPFTGTLTLSAVNTGNGTVTNVFTSTTSGSVPLDGLIISGAITNFAAPTIDGASGNISGNLASAAAVPEPASLALLGLGLIGLGGVSAYRRRRAG